MSKSPNQKIYVFEDYRLDAAHLLLYRNNEKLPLAPKVVETLLVLVENRGKILNSDELMERIWTDSIVEENNLSQNLFRLRKILGDTKDGKPFIETLRRRGYRFVPEVRCVEAEEKSGPENLVESKPAYNHQFKVERRGNVLAVAEWLREAETAQIALKAQPLIRETESSPQKSGSRFISLSIGLLLTVAVTAGFFLSFYDGANNRSFDKTNIKRLTESGNLRGATISPDGNLLAYVLVEGKNLSLRLKNILTKSEVVIIAPTETQLGQPRFSSDSNFIYYETREGTFQIPVFGGEPRRINADIWGGSSLSPDGKQVAFLRGNQIEQKNSIIVADINGDGERVVAERADPDFYVGSGTSPAWSPDGQHLTVVAGKRGSQEIGLLEVNLQTGAEREMKTADVWETISFIRWASREELLVCAKATGNVTTQIWSVKFPGGKAERITNDFNDYLGLSVSRDGGKILAVQETEIVHLWLFDKETGAAQQITSGVSRSDGRFGLALAPDKRVIFTARDKNDYDIFSVNSDGGDMRRLTRNVGRRNTDAVVSRDNQFIVFVSDRSGDPRLWRMNLDGSAARRLTDLSDDKEKSEGSPYFSADGQWIYYVFRQNGKGAIRKIPGFGGQSIAVSQTDKNVYEPVASPDGTRLAHAVYNDEAKPPWQVGVMSLENPSTPERYFDFPAVSLRVRWLLDSHSVVSAEVPTEGGNLWETNLTSGERRQITKFKTGSVYRFDISADNRFYVFSRGEYFHDAVLIEQ